MKYQIINGNNIDVLKTFPDNHFDSIVTDPPYGIDFLGKTWDANTGALETYQECLRVLKPGGHILAFSAARTYHHLAITLEQAGFEIRDQIMWIYSSGFPKSQDVGRQLHKKANGKPDKQRFDKSIMIKEGNDYRHPENNKLYRILPDINGDRLEKSHEGESYGYVFEEIIKIEGPWVGWGTSLKPAHEPVCMARKPMKHSIAKNVQVWGTGALNIDAARIDWEPGEQEKEQAWRERYSSNSTGAPTFSEDDINEQRKNIKEQVVRDAPAGRFPSNVIGEIPDYQKYFYCPKVSRNERHAGFDLKQVPVIEFNDPETIHLHPLWTPAMGKNVYRLKQAIEEQQTVKIGNNHPTVKPVELMKYLIKLVTPPNGLVLDPFNGSGSTGMAAVELGHEYVGIELDPAYVEIAKKRIEAWNKTSTAFEEIFE